MASLSSLDSSILNVGLDLAMEFGKNWLKPIQSRLAERYPTLATKDLDAYDTDCRACMTYANDLIVRCWRETKGSQDESFRLFQERVLGRYAWVSAPNLARLFSQSCYYAWKDGDLP